MDLRKSAFIGLQAKSGAYPPYDGDLAKYSGIFQGMTIGVKPCRAGFSCLNRNNVKGGNRAVLPKKKGDKNVLQR